MWKKVTPIYLFVTRVWWAFLGVPSPRPICPAGRFGHRTGLRNRSCNPFGTRASHTSQYAPTPRLTCLGGPSELRISHRSQKHSLKRSQGSQKYKQTKSHQQFRCDQKWKSKRQTLFITWWFGSSRPRPNTRFPSATTHSRTKSSGWISKDKC